MGGLFNSYDFCQIVLWNQIWGSSLEINSSLKKETRVSLRKNEKIKTVKENWYVPEGSKGKDYKDTVKERYEFLPSLNTIKITLKEKSTWVAGN